MITSYVLLSVEVRDMQACSAVVDSVIQGSHSDTVKSACIYTAHKPGVDNLFGL